MKSKNHRRAITTCEISGSCIKTIPEGTTFTITYRGDIHSSCTGLGITEIYNNEYKYLDIIPKQ